MHEQDHVTAQGRYETLARTRSPVLQRAREAAEYTIPGLMPPEGSTDSHRFTQPFQSIGARGVNNLASKLLLALFPPGAAFFRLTVDEAVMDELRESAGGSDPTREVEEALRKVEQGVLTRLDQRGARRTLHETIKQLLCAGNALLQINKEGSLKMHRLDSFVVKRDLEGQPIEIILREGLSPLTLPEEVRKIVEGESPEKMKGRSDKEQSGDDTIWLYTSLQLDKRTWRTFQEVEGQRVPHTEGSFPKDKPAFLPLRWNTVDGEDYGRGHVEEYMGDLRSLEAISQSIVEFAAAASKILFLVDEAGTTSKDKLEKALSGDIVDGDARDITVLQVEKFADFQIVDAVASRVEKRLEEAFLLNKSVTRQAERVTAEEIRFVAGELEQALGGVYATLAQEMQRPLVIRLLAAMQRSRDLPALPDKAIRPEIVTGLEGLGRSSDLNKLDLLVSGLQSAFGPEAVAEYINPGAYALRRATALGIEIEGVVRSEEEVQQVRQQKMMSETVSKLGPNAVTAAQKQAQSQAELNAQTEEQ